MAFQQGLSGLNSSSRAIQTVSNNIANSSTVGFKSATVQFGDIYGAALTGMVQGGQSGIGGTVQAVKQSFTQGNLTATGNPLDMAINGNGFFKIDRSNGTEAYTRNGQFDVDAKGFVVTAVGEKLVGYQVVPNSIPPRIGDIQGPLQIPQSIGNPKYTESVSIRANLDSREAAPTVMAFDPSDIESYNSTASLNIFDTQGNPRVLTLFFIKNAAPNEWTVEARIDGVDAGSANNLTFDERGQIGAVTTVNVGIPADGQVEAMDVEVNLENLTQFGSPFAVTELAQDGFGPGQLAGLSVSQEGIIQGRYSNGQTQNIGQVALYNFASPVGLVSLGNNLWAATLDSGEPVPGKPGVGLNGVISSGMVEDSNVDLTQELVALIVQQRNYQANAQSIRAQDQLLQTMVNLR